MDRLNRVIRMPTCTVLWCGVPFPFCPATEVGWSLSEAVRVRPSVRPFRARRHHD